MIRIEFTQEEIEQLNYERYHHPHPRVQRKMSVVYLKSQGLKHKEIERLENICGNTQLEYLREYQEGGIERLKEIHFYSPKSELQEHVKSIEGYFKNNPPASINEAVAKIEEITGIKKKRESVRVFLKKNGFEPRKVGTINEAQAGKRTLFLWTQRTLSTPHF